MNRYISGDLSGYLFQNQELPPYFTPLIDQWTENTYRIFNLNTEFLDIFKVKKFIHQELQKIIHYIMYHTTPSDIIETDWSFFPTDEKAYHLIRGLCEYLCYYQEGVCQWYNENDWYDLVDQMHDPLQKALLRVYRKYLQHPHSLFSRQPLSFASAHSIDKK